MPNKTENEVIRQLGARKSVRVFTGQAVDAATRAAILNAAFEAPTAGCQQLYTILDITDPALRHTLAVLCDNQPMIEAAPLCLVFLADCHRWPQAYRAAGMQPRRAGAGDLLLAMADACIAAQNAVTAAESLGLGSCYVGDVLENCEQMRQALALPLDVVPATLVIFGYPTQQQKRRAKPARFDEAAVVCQNTYTPRTEAELRADFAARAAKVNDAIPYDFDKALTAFGNRKYQSEFSREMSRSAAVYLQEFLRGE